MISGWRPSIIVPVVVLLAVVLVGAIIAVPDAGDLPAPAPTTPDTRAACDDLVDEMVSTMQRFVDQYEGASVRELLGGVPYPKAVDLEHESERFEARLGVLGCQPHELSDVMVAQVAGVQGEGPLARALAASIRASVQRELHQTQAAGDGATREVAPGEDLAEAAAEVTPGTRLLLGAGDHVLTQTLVLLHEVEIEGDGPETTRIVSEAEDAAIVSVGAGVLSLTGVTIEHSGPAAADLLVAGSGQFRVQDARLTGAVRDEDGGGGTALLAATVEAARALVPGASTAPPAVRELVDVQIVDNQGEGVTLLGGGPVSVERATFSGNGSCGLCLLGVPADVRDTTFLGNGIGVAVVQGADLTADRSVFQSNAEAGVVFEDTTTGTIRASTFEANGSVGLAINGTASPVVDDSAFLSHEGVALAVSDEATPTIADSRFGSNAIAIQLSGTSGAVVHRNAIAGAGRVGILVGGQATAEVEANELTGALQVGVQLQEQADPRLLGNTLRTSGRVGVLFLDSARGLVSGTTLDGQEIAVQVRDDAAPAVRRNVLTGYERIGMVYTGRAAGTVSGNRCLSPGVGVLLLEDAKPVLDDNDCQPLDLRG